MNLDYEEILNELENWLENQRLRNSEWDKFVVKDNMIGIPISYLLNKIEELKKENRI